MNELLVQLNQVRGVGGSLLVSQDGLPIASALRQGVEENDLSAALGNLIEGAGRLGTTFKLGRPNGYHAASDNGGILLLATGPAWLAIVIDPSANLALLQLETRPFVERIAQRLTL